MVHVEEKKSVTDIAYMLLLTRSWSRDALLHAIGIRNRSQFNRFLENEELGIKIDIPKTHASIKWNIENELNTDIKPRIAEITKNLEPAVGLHLGAVHRLQKELYRYNRRKKELEDELQAASKGKFKNGRTIYYYATLDWLFAFWSRLDFAGWIAHKHPSKVEIKNALQSFYHPYGNFFKDFLNIPSVKLRLERFSFNIIKAIGVNNEHVDARQTLTVFFKEFFYQTFKGIILTQNNIADSDLCAEDGKFNRIFDRLKDFGDYPATNKNQEDEYVRLRREEGIIKHKYMKECWDSLEPDVADFLRKQKEKLKKPQDGKLKKSYDYQFVIWFIHDCMKNALTMGFEIAEARDFWQNNVDKDIHQEVISAGSNQLDSFEYAVLFEPQKKEND